MMFARVIVLSAAGVAGVLYAADPTKDEQLAYARAEHVMLREAASLANLRAEFLAAKEKLRLAAERVQKLRREAENKAGCILTEDLSRCESKEPR